MSLTVHQFPCLSDNYGFLVRDEATGQVASIDSPDAAAILAALSTLGWNLTLVLNTHWHADHAGGNAELKAVTGCQVWGPAEVERLTPVDRQLNGGDQVQLGETTFQVLETGGHTLGHLSYYSAKDDVAFVGDTLFAMGCGRMFEGSPSQMWASLQTLAALPEHQEIIGRLRAEMPKHDEPDAPVNKLSPEEKKAMAKKGRKGKAPSADEDK